MHKADGAAAQDLHESVQILAQPFVADKRTIAHGDGKLVYDGADESRIDGDLLRTWKNKWEVR